MRNLLLFICLSVSVLTIAQTNASPERRSVGYLKYDIGSVFGDQITPSVGVQIGVECKLKENMSIEQDLMYIFHCANSIPSFATIEVEEVFGIKSITELRFYRNNNDKIEDLLGLYFCPNLICQYTKAMRKNENTDSPNYYVHRYVLALHAKIGYQTKIFRNCVLDFATGFGARYISSQSTSKIVPIYNTEYEYPYSKPYDSGASFFPSLTFSIRVACKI
jgi:hypothetical protein